MPIECVSATGLIIMMLVNNAPEFQVMCIITYYSELHNTVLKQL